MIIYQKCLKRLALAQIVLTAIEILVVILIYAFLRSIASAEAHKASLITSLPQYGIERKRYIFTRGDFCCQM